MPNVYDCGVYFQHDALLCIEIVNCTWRVDECPVFWFEIFGEELLMGKVDAAVTAADGWVFYLDVWLDAAADCEGDPLLQLDTIASHSSTFILRFEDGVGWMKTIFFHEAKEKSFMLEIRLNTLPAQIARKWCERVLSIACTCDFSNFMTDPIFEATKMNKFYWTLAFA